VNLGELRARVRRLTDVFANDLVEDALIDDFINEAYDEIATSRIWPWLDAKTTLVNNQDVPAFDEIFHPALSYRAAQKVLTHQSDTTERGQTYLQEYASLVQRMEELYMPAIASGSRTTLEDLRWLVRDLIGAYSFELSDNMINALVNEAYNDLARFRPWPWLEATHEELLNPGDVSFSLPHGARRVLTMFYDNGSRVVEIIARPQLVDVPVNSARVFYDVDYSGNVTIAPVQTKPITVTARYMVRNVELDEEGETAFDDQFNALLAYMTAIKAFGVYGKGRAIPDALSAQVQAMLDGMISEYMVEHTDRPIRMGGSSGFGGRRPSYIRYI
jgi:hypothetical protein